MHLRRLEMNTLQFVLIWILVAIYGLLCFSTGYDIGADSIECETCKVCKEDYDPCEPKTHYEQFLESPLGCEMASWEGYIE